MSGNHVNFGGDRELRPAYDRLAPEPSLDGLRILVIEDTALIRRVMECLLTSWGCRVTLADGALMACDQVQHDQAPDIILSDYQLNDGYNGINAIRLVRELVGRQVPACLISAAEVENLWQQAEVADAYFLQKPVNSTELRSVLWRLVQSGVGGV